MFWHFKVPGYRSEEMLNRYDVHSCDPFSFLQMTENWHTDSDNIQETDTTHYCHSVPIPHRLTGTPCQL